MSKSNKETKSAVQREKDLAEYLQNKDDIEEMRRGREEYLHDKSEFMESKREALRGKAQNVIDRIREKEEMVRDRRIAKDDLLSKEEEQVKYFQENARKDIELELERRRKLQEQIEELLKTKVFNEKSLPKASKTSRKEIIEKLKHSYKNEKLVFVIGAGLSISFGLPSWNTLLQKLMVTTIENEQSASNALSKLFTEIFAPSPLIAGRYLQKFYETNHHSFEEAVRNVLYAEFDINKASELMNEIIKFCVAAGKSPNLDSVITYNFDDIIEQHLESLSSIEIPYKSIFGVGMNPEPGELPIYHVHGFLPKSGKLNDDNQITFGENIYHKQYSDIYSWNNIVQINKFRDFNCLFIGTSLTDPNIRRLLDIAKLQKGKSKEFHFIFKKKYKEEEVSRGLERLLEQNKILLDEKTKANLNFEETVKFLIKTIESFEENDSSSFGVKTIWVDDYSDIPEILKEVRTE
jgi:hypothetical protein